MTTRNLLKTLNTSVAVIALATGSMLISGEILAAPTQGTLGATSTGIVNITVTKAAQAQISSLSDMALPSYSIGGGDQALNTTACVYSTSGDYTIKATGNGASSAFTITDGGVGALHVVPYTVVWDSGGFGALTGVTTAALTTNTTSATLHNAAVDSATCVGVADTGPTAKINVGILGTDLDGAAAGVFTGTLTLLVTPI